MSNSYGLQLAKKLNEKIGYPESLKLGYADAINDLREIEESDQPTLNNNQQVLLKWLKKKCDDCAFIPFNPFSAIRSLYYLGLDLDEIEVRNIIDELNRKQQAQVLQVFSQWVLEQEADNE